MKADAHGVLRQQVAGMVALHVVVQHICRLQGDTK